MKKKGFLNVHFHTHTHTHFVYWGTLGNLKHPNKRMDTTPFLVTIIKEEDKDFDH